MMDAHNGVTDPIKRVSGEQLGIVRMLNQLTLVDPRRFPFLL